MNFQKSHRTRTPAHYADIKTLKKPAPAETGKTSRLLIFIGYFFAILGSIIGLIIAIYLITRKDPSAKKHGYIQIAIILFYAILLAIMFATGAIPPEVITDYKNLLLGNFTPFNR